MEIYMELSEICARDPAQVEATCTGLPCLVDKKMTLTETRNKLHRFLLYSTNYYYHVSMGGVFYFTYNPLTIFLLI
jgi:hypothetical protein